MANMDHTKVMTYSGDTVLKSQVKGPSDAVIYTREGTTPTEVTYYTEGVKKGMLTGEEWFRCSVCGFNYPKSRMEFVGSRPYCIPQGCHRDIPQLRRRDD